MQKYAQFGPAGNCEAFASSGGKHTKDVFAFLKKYGLDAYEYQGGNGIRGSNAAFSAIGEAARAAGIKTSVHAPYFISLSGVVEETRLKSIDYIKTTLNCASLIGADTIVIHTGSAAKITREEAMALASDTLRKVIDATEEYKDIKLGLETMGKINQLGTIDEVLTLCKISPRLAPVFDFGHINSREGGGVFPTVDSFRRVFDKIAVTLGDEYAKDLHCHYSQIEWSAGGEKKHLRFDTGAEWGPDYHLFCEAIAKEGLTPRVICESDGSMSEDALKMKKEYLSHLN